MPAAFQLNECVAYRGMMSMLRGWGAKSWMVQFFDQAWVETFHRWITVGFEGSVWLGIFHARLAQAMLATCLIFHVIAAFVLDVTFATLLWGHWQFGWRGRTAIRWTLGGFIFLMLAYFGSKLVLELLLQP